MKSATNSGCLTAMVTTFSRIMLICYWIARPVQMDMVFSTFIVPCLGLMILPFTTLMYVLLWSPQVGIQGLDWVWLALAAVLDIASMASAGVANRDRLPAEYRRTNY